MRSMTGWVLVHRAALLRAIDAALKRAGRGGPVIDATQGISLDVSVVGDDFKSGGSSSSLAVFTVELDYALFQTPQHIHFIAAEIDHHFF